MSSKLAARPVVSLNTRDLGVAVANGDDDAGDD